MLQHQAELLSSVWLETTPCGETWTITAFGIYLLLHMLFHSFATMLLGRPPQHLSVEVEQHLATHDPEVARRWGKEQREHTNELCVRHCGTCKVVKPMRAHHCRACGQCGLKMDHRQSAPSRRTPFWFVSCLTSCCSPSVCAFFFQIVPGSCVGWRNHRHCIRFLVFLWSGCGFFLIASIDSAFPVLMGSSRSGNDSCLLLSSVVCVAALVAAGLFLLWSGYLLVTNQTTIEFCGNQWGDNARSRGETGNSYDMGTARNIKQVFGEQPLFLLLCPSLVIGSDGIIYPLNGGRGMPLHSMIDERTA